MTTTPNAYSLKGWSLKTWVVKNKDSLKLIVAGATGLVTATIASSNPAISVTAGSIIAAVSKMILDTIDYWQSE